MVGMGSPSRSGRGDRRRVGGIIRVGYAQSAQGLRKTQVPIHGDDTAAWGGCSEAKARLEFARESCARERSTRHGALEDRGAELCCPLLLGKFVRGSPQPTTGAIGHRPQACPQCCDEWRLRLQKASQRPLPDVLLPSNTRGNFSVFRHFCSTCLNILYITVEVLGSDVNNIWTPLGFQ